MAAAEIERSVLRIRALRGGEVEELCRFLTDLNTAYAALYGLRQTRKLGRRLSRMFPEEFLALGFGSALQQVNEPLTNEFIAPDFRLVLSQVEIHSPGIWEFLGQINPLQQIREYLKDRHERTKDRKWREKEEQEKFRLENEWLRQQIRLDAFGLMRDEIEFMDVHGFDESQLQQILWQKIGVPLARLGKHQDTGLIAGIADDDQNLPDFIKKSGGR